MYACWNFYSLMCPDTWDTGNTGTICIRHGLGISDRKSCLSLSFCDFYKEDRLKLIKIYADSQLVLLRNINPLLGRYRIPREIIKRMDYLMQTEELGTQGFLIVLLSPVRDDIREIEDAVNAYPLKIDFPEAVEREEVKDNHCELGRDRDWFVEKLHIQETTSQICVLYSVLRKHLYKNG